MPNYPGLGLDLRVMPNAYGDKPYYPLGIHPSCPYSQSDMLLVREVAMMIVMDRLTDKPNWHVKIFDPEISRKWAHEALALPVEPLYDEITGDKSRHSESGGWQFSLPEKRLGNILSKQCVNFCIQELRQKAEYFKATGMIPTLDACASVAKSDCLVDQELHNSLQNAFAKLKEHQAQSPDWHPGTDAMVQDLVHPSLYPLVYGRSRVLEDELVGVDDAVDKWAGKGEIIPIPAADPVSNHRTRYFTRDDDMPNFWSTKFQWLPANVAVQEDDTVKFTSYVNNLHPTKHADIYRTLEKLIAKAIPMWEQCLAAVVHREKDAPGGVKPRFPQPKNPDDDNELNWDPSSPDGLSMPETMGQNSHDGDMEAGDDTEIDLEQESDEDDEEDDEKFERWRDLRAPVQPEPPKFEGWDYDVDPEMTLRAQFGRTGLQVIVKMASIELTPEKPEFSGGGWHVEGQMNEHIVATALYYVDSENITASHLKFRMATSSHQEDRWNVGQDSYSWLEAVFGTRLGGGNSPCLQNYGSVETKQGRLLAFPNVFQHRVSGFKLQDPSKPGHRRFVALWLVDPHTRIINTGNVPPQQADWWLERAMPTVTPGGDGGGRKPNLPPEAAQLILENYLDKETLDRRLGQLGNAKLPAEIMAIVREDLNDSLPISRQEAEKYRDELMEVRKAHEVRARNAYHGATYSFCEH